HPEQDYFGRSLEPVEKDLHCGITRLEDVAAAVRIDAGERSGQERAGHRGAAVQLGLRALEGRRVIGRHRRLKVEAVAARDMAVVLRATARDDVVRPDHVLEVSDTAGGVAEPDLRRGIAEIDGRATRQKPKQGKVPGDPHGLTLTKTLHP